MCRVYGCCAEKLFVMRVMNEEAAHKFQAVNCEASVDGDYLGVVLESKPILYILVDIGNCKLRLKSITICCS